MKNIKLGCLLFIFLIYSIPTMVGAQSTVSDVQLNQVEENLTEIAKQIGGNQLNELINGVQTVIDGEQPIQFDQMKEIFLNEAEKMGISLTEDQQQILVNSMQALQDLNVGWDVVKDQLTNAISEIEQFTQTEQGENFIQQIFSGIKLILDAVLSLF